MSTVSLALARVLFDSQSVGANTAIVFSGSMDQAMRQFPLMVCW
jgi:hypothetical protein